MNKPEPSKFRFTNFLVRESHFIMTELSDYQLSIDIQPGGRLYPDLKQFELYLNVSILDQQGLLKIEVKTVSFFETDEVDNLVENPYFTINAPAIVYPYVRAYIGTLTTQSGINAILLPAMNLQPLGESLKKNIEVISGAVQPE